MRDKHSKIKWSKKLHQDELECINWMHSNELRTFLARLMISTMFSAPDWCIDHCIDDAISA